MDREEWVTLVYGSYVPILGALVTHYGANGYCCFFMMFLYISMVGSSNIIILSGIWVIRANFGGSGHALRGKWLLLFFMMFLYISMVGSSNIIILSGMGHTCQFWGLWSRITGQMVTVVFDDVSIHQYGWII